MAEWNSLQNMRALRWEIDRVFHDFGFREEPSQRAAFLPGKEPRRYPMINLLEDKDNLYVEALTPGIDPQSLNVTVLQNRVTLAGEKSRVASEIKTEAFHRNERASGKFVRVLDLPVEVDGTKVGAEYKNGLLVLTLPKAEKAKPKQIAINIA
jgi:HSP20 family protein